MREFELWDSMPRVGEEFKCLGRIFRVVEANYETGYVKLVEMQPLEIFFEFEFDPAILADIWDRQ